MKTLSACALLIAGLCVAAPSVSVLAQGNASPAAHSPAKKHAGKNATKKKNARAVNDGDPEPDITGQSPVNFDCELGNKLTIYRHAGDDEHIALRWHKRLHQLTRVRTTTGANRFENTRKGLVWIAIPAKSMLLDSKKGQQLANECHSPEQEAALRQTQQASDRHN